MQLIKQGSAGVYVQYLSLALIRSGYLETITDNFDQNVFAAVTAFQNDNNLTADGIVGTATWQALEPYLTGYRTVTAAEGDTIAKIAGQYNTSEQAIAIANPGLVDSIPAGTEVTVPLRFDVVPTNVSYTYELVQLIEEGIAARYPFVVRGSAGKSVMGRDLSYLELGNGSTEVFFNASHHANEWITTPVVLKYAEDYAKAYAYGSNIYNSSARQLFDEKKLYILPLVNPDGVDLVNGGISDEYFLNITKQISDRYPSIPYPSGWKANIAGTDLNLNYPAGWIKARENKFALGFTTPAPRDYVGETPLSAIESRALYDFTLNHSFALTISYHTQGNVIYWKYADYQPENSLEIGNALAAASGYTLSVTPSESAYAGYKDWFISYFNLPGYTVEVGLGTNPLPISQFDGIYNSNLPLMTTALELA
ncbi:MAG: peptidoglycan-binding protein [Clostridia bacterium]|nr:peptidoglycan-binding protein [Clostridia bacterium]